MEDSPLFLACDRDFGAADGTSGRGKRDFVRSALDDDGGEPAQRQRRTEAEESGTFSGRGNASTAALRGSLDKKAARQRAAEEDAARDALRAIGLSPDPSPIVPSRNRYAF